jgi:predicted branched-subunit amino acid permease
MPDNSSSHHTVNSMASRFARGIRLGLPILLGYMPVGIAFGVLATTIGFTAIQAMVCSATALAGAGQFIALNLMKDRADVFAVVAATTVVNLRYVLFGATLSPHLRGMSAGKQALLAFTLTDETFAVNVSDRRSGYSTGASMAGVGAIAWVGWVAGTAIGAMVRYLDRRSIAMGYGFRDACHVHRLASRTRRGPYPRRRGGTGGCIRNRTSRARSFRPRLSWIIIASIGAATIGAVLFR